MTINTQIFFWIIAHVILLTPFQAIELQIKHKITGEHEDFSFPNAQNLHSAPKPLFMAKSPIIYKIPNRKHQWIFPTVPPHFDAYADILPTINEATVNLCRLYLYSFKTQSPTDNSNDNSPFAHCAQRDEIFETHPPFPTKKELQRLTEIRNQGTVPIELDWPLKFTRNFVPKISPYTHLFLCINTSACAISFENSLSTVKHEILHYKNLTFLVIPKNNTLQYNMPNWILLCTTRDPDFHTECKARVEAQYYAVQTLPFVQRIKTGQLTSNPNPTRTKRIIGGILGGLIVKASIDKQFKKIHTQLTTMADKHNELVALLEDKWALHQKKLTLIDKAMLDTITVTKDLLYELQIQDARNVMLQLDNLHTVLFDNIMATHVVFQHHLDNPSKHFMFNMLSIADNTLQSIPILHNLHGFTLTYELTPRNYIITITAPGTSSDLFTELIQFTPQSLNCTMNTPNTVQDDNNSTFPALTALQDVINHFHPRGYTSYPVTVARIGNKLMYVSNPCFLSHENCTYDFIRHVKTPFEPSITSWDWQCDRPTKTTGIQTTTGFSIALPENHTKVFIHFCLLAQPLVFTTKAATVSFNISPDTGEEPCPNGNPYFRLAQRLIHNSLPNKQPKQNTHKIFTRIRQQAILKLFQKPKYYPIQLYTNKNSTTQNNISSFTNVTIKLDNNTEITTLDFIEDIISEVKSTTSNILDSINPLPGIGNWIQDILTKVLITLFTIFAIAGLIFFCIQAVPHLLKRRRHRQYTNAANATFELVQRQLQNQTPLIHDGANNSRHQHSRPISDIPEIPPPMPIIKNRRYNEAAAKSHLAQIRQKTLETPHADQLPQRKLLPEQSSTEQ